MDAVYSNYSPIFLYVNKYSFSGQWVYQESRVPYSLVRYICSGSALFEIDGVGYEVKKDSVFYIPQGSSMYCAAHESLVFISIRFIGSVQLPGTDMLKQLWNITQLYHCADHLEMKLWFTQIMTSAVSKDTCKRLETRGYLNLILAALARKSATGEWFEEDAAIPLSAFDIESLRKRAQASHVTTDPRIRVLIDYLTLNPQINLTRDKMCEMCGMSESTLRRLFRQHTGKTIHDFMKETRMVYAAHKLVTTNEPISSIGYDLGYESSSYFTKAFRETFGTSPQTYRNQSQNT